MIKQSLEAITKHKLIFIEEIISFVTFSKQTFYTHGLDEVDELKEALNKNRVEIKKDLRDKWYKSDNPTVQIALYKLTGSDEERKLLSTNYNEHTIKTEQPLFPDVSKDNGNK
jgi:hypothetical protein